MAGEAIEVDVAEVSDLVAIRWPCSGFTGTSVLEWSPLELELELRLLHVACMRVRTRPETEGPMSTAVIVGLLADDFTIEGTLLGTPFT